MISLNRSIVRVTGVLLAMLMACGYAPAKTVMEIESGFDGRFRPGRWSPVFVTVKSDSPRTAIVELRVPNASASAMTIRQAIGVGIEQQKYVLYAPLSMLYDPLRATLIDAETGKLLAQWPESDREDIDRGGQQVGFMIVTAGRAPLLQSYRRTAAQGSTIVSHQRYSLLPTTAIGYDSIDILYLNNPEWDRLTTDQQWAMIAWAKAGGTILLYPGAEVVPDDAPLAQVLPCTIGTPSVQTLTPEQLKQLSLPKRFESIAVRGLMPNKGSQFISLPNDLPRAISGRVGLGQIVVTPIDIGTLQFNDANVLEKFVGTFIDAIVKSPDKPENSYNYYDADITAAHAALNRIGDIPNTGGFGFSYIALVVGGLMLIVGPIDWLVLKKLGKQPWTWATTIGWIGVFTCGALYAGHLLRSGDLHFRSIQLIDQSNDRVIATEDIALIYAPKSADYQITSDPTTWWQPVPNGQRYSNNALTLPIRTEQTYRGNMPDAMWIDVWNWRFLRGTRYVDQPPIVQCNLTYDSVTQTVSGTITNTSDSSLSAIQLRIADASIEIDGAIQPKESHTIKGKFVKPSETNSDDNYSFPRGNAYYGNTPDTSYETIFRLSPSRANAADRLLREGGIVMYAQIDQPNSDVSITNPSAVVEHRALLRVLVQPVIKN